MMDIAVSNDITVPFLRCINQAAMAHGVARIQNEFRAQPSNDVFALKPGRREPFEEPTSRIELLHRNPAIEA